MSQNEVNRSQDVALINTSRLGVLSLHVPLPLLISFSRILNMSLGGVTPTESVQRIVDTFSKTS